MKRNSLAYNVVGFLIAISIATVIFHSGMSWSGRVLKEKNENINARMQKSICIVDKAGNFKGNYINVSFFYKGKKVSGRESAPSRDYLRGEKYVIEFDSITPENFRVRLDQPVIDDIKNYVIRRGVVQQVEEGNIVKYTYNYKEESFVKYEMTSGENAHQKGDTIYLLVNRMQPRNAYIKDNLRRFPDQ